MAEEEIGSKEQAPKSNRILFCYFFIVLLLGLVAIGILVRAFDTAFVERETWMKVAESQKRPNRLIYPSRGNIYSSDGKLMATSVPCFYLYIDFNADCYTLPFGTVQERLLHAGDGRTAEAVRDIGLPYDRRYVPRYRS